MSKKVIICCQSIEKEMRFFLKEADSKTELLVMPPYFHAHPDQLNAALQKIIDQISGVDRIYICQSGCGCGGATEALKATTAELVMPKTHNCIDLMLSKTSVADIERPTDGMFLTEGWLPYLEKGMLDYPYLVQTMGEKEAYAYANKLFGKFNTFYIVDTVPYDMEKVVEFIMPLVLAVHGQIKYLDGPCGLMRRIVREEIDAESFFIIPKGSQKEKNM